MNDKKVGEYGLLLPRKPPPLFQVRARAKRSVDITGYNQRSCRPLGTFVMDIGDMARQVGEQGAGNGIAGFRVIE